MQEKKQNRKLIIIVFIAAIFGLLGGIAGEIVARVYLLDNALNIPFFGEINISNGDFRGPSVIIRDAKKVVIEQNEKAIKTIESADNVMVGIFRKHSLDNSPDVANTSLNTKNKIQNFDVNNYYNFREHISQGLIITSDGWIITNFLPKEIKSKALRPVDQKTLDNYVVITKDRKIYDIDNFLRDPLSSFSLLHVNEKNFSVKKLVDRNEIKSGQIVIAVNWDRQSLISTIVTNRKIKEDVVNYSDAFGHEIILANKLEGSFNGSFLFNLFGDVVALIDKNGRIFPISNFISAIQSTLRYKSIKRASLGVYYVNISDFVMPQNFNEMMAIPDKGAMIYKNNKGVAVLKDGAGFKAGLREGDIIITVDNKEVDKANDLTEILLDYVAGDEANIVYLRDGEEKEVEVRLGEIK